MASLKGKDKQELRNVNESSKQLKDIQENIAKMLSMLIKTKKLLQSVVKKVDLFEKKVESIESYTVCIYRAGVWMNKTTKLAFWKQKCKLQKMNWIS